MWIHDNAHQKLKVQSSDVSLTLWRNNQSWKFSSVHKLV